MEVERRAEQRRWPPKKTLKEFRANMEIPNVSNLHILERPIFANPPSQPALK